jgi:hypothetical protein
MRFINADPIGFAGGSNWYAYAGNSPLMFVDPSGFCRDSSGGGSWFDSVKNYAFRFGTGFAHGAEGFIQAAQEPFAFDPIFGPIYRTAKDVYSASQNPDGFWTGMRDISSQNGDNLVNFVTTPEGHGAVAFNIVLIVATKKVAGGIGKMSGISAAKNAAVRWGPATGAGPLGEKVAATFRGGSYTQTVTTEATTLYRAYGGTAGEVGGYWTRTAPTGPLQARVDSALAPQWGNTARSVSTIRVPAGITIFEGFAAPQGNLIGVGSQVFIQNVNPVWLVK